MHGGSRGTPEEAKINHAWPQYEASFLKDRLVNGGGKYGTGAKMDVAQHVYFDKVSEDYKSEADENLRREFNDWLQGMHETNTSEQVYPSTRRGDSLGGAAKRRSVYGEEGETVGTELNKAWNPTYWGRKQLTHLPGVREYLRGGFESTEAAELQMNVLAEHGPQDLEQAWMYFKHWVKKRPVTFEHPLYIDGIDTDKRGKWGKNGAKSKQELVTNQSIGRRSDFRHQPPGGWPDPVVTVPDGGDGDDDDGDDDDDDDGLDAGFNEVPPEATRRSLFPEGRRPTRSNTTAFGDYREPPRSNTGAAAAPPAPGDVDDQPNSPNLASDVDDLLAALGASQWNFSDPGEEVAPEEEWSPELDPVNDLQALLEEVVAVPLPDDTGGGF